MSAEASLHFDMQYSTQYNTVHNTIQYTIQYSSAVLFMNSLVMLYSSQLIIQIRRGCQLRLPYILTCNTVHSTQYNTVHNTMQHSRAVHVIAWSTSLLLLDWAQAVWRISEPEKIWQIFYLKFLLDFLAVGFAYYVNNILSYLNITNLPRRKEDSLIEKHTPSLWFKLSIQKPQVW